MDNTRREKRHRILYLYIAERLTLTLAHAVRRKTTANRDCSYEVTRTLASRSTRLCNVVLTRFRVVTPVELLSPNNVIWLSINSWFNTRCFNLFASTYGLEESTAKLFLSFNERLCPG